MDDLERARIGVVDAPLLVRELVHQDVHLDAVIGECARLVETKGLEIPRHHFHGGDPAGFHGRHEVGPGLERRLACGPEAQTAGIGESGHGGGAGGGHVGDPGVGQGVLQAEAGAALCGRFHVAARTLAASGIGHGMGLVEDDGAVEGVAVVLVGSTGEPAHDLVEPRGAALAGRRAQRGVGREQDAGRVGNLGSLAEVAEGDHVVLASSEGGPVAAGVFQELVGLAEPQSALAAAEPAVEDDRRDLPPLAAARAVAQHPAAAEAYRRGQGLAVVREGGLALVVVAAALDNLPAGADPVACREVALVGLARQDDALELRVRQETLRHDAVRQHGAVGRRRVRDGGHCRGLHQGCRMGGCGRDVECGGPPRFIGSGGGVAGVRGGVHGPGFDGEFGHGSPVMGRCGCGRRALSQRGTWH